MSFVLQRQSTYIKMMHEHAPLHHALPVSSACYKVVINRELLSKCHNTLWMNGTAALSTCLLPHVKWGPAGNDMK